MTPTLSAEYAYKPDSFPRKRGGHHLSGPRVAGRLGAMWLVRPGRPPPEGGYQAILLQVGFTRDRVSADRRELLPHDFTLTPNRQADPGRFVSVALSFESPRQDVILHHAQ